MKERPVLFSAIILSIIVEVILMVLVYDKIGGERLPVQIGRFLFQLICVFLILTNKSNTALFDAQMISMAILNPGMDELEQIDKPMVIDSLAELLGNEEFYATITKGTTDRNTVHKRINDYTNFLRDLLN